MKKHHLVIIGGGFAGLRLTRKLRKSKNIKITLITDSTTFRYSPALYRSATGFKMRESIIPIVTITKNYANLRLITQKATKVNRTNKTVSTADGKSHSYDSLVICTGVVTSYFGIPGLEDLSFSIKTPEGLEKLKTHLHKTLNDTGNPDANYVVVGGGPTGVELSAALIKYLKYICKKHKTKKHTVNIELVEAAPRLLPVLSERASDLTAKRLRKLGIKLLIGQTVKAETPESLTLAERSIPSHTVIWTAGVTNNPFFKQNKDQFNLNERGKAIVDEHLQVDENTYVIGDNAATKYGGLALTAIRDANFVHKNIIKSIKNRKTKPYVQKKPISVVPAGESWSILQYDKFVISGIIPSILRSLADLVGYADIMGIKIAISVWLSKSLHEETCPACKVSLFY